jgi:hypothetical protein
MENKRNKLFIILLASVVFTLALTKPALSSVVDSQCSIKEVSIYRWGVRHVAALPATLNVQPNSLLQACIRLKGVGDAPLTLKSKRIALSVNGAPFVTNQALTIRDDDEIRLRLKAPNHYGTHDTVRLVFFETDKSMRRDVFRISWQIQTINNVRQPRVWEVGSDKRFKQVSDILPKLVAGDTIVLNEKEEFAPFEAKFISGTEDEPITLTSSATDAKNRPAFRGGVKKYGWNIGLRGSHYWTIKNVKLQDSLVCFRNEATGTVLRNVYISGCHNGVLGTDYNSGSLTISHSEITQSGGLERGGKWGHAIYVASDQHSFPDSQFQMDNSFLHGNKGNNVKSRFQNTVIAHNWIEPSSDNQARYLLELIGYDGIYDFAGQQYDVNGNILIHRRPGLGARVGGDGKSASRGDIIYDNNLFVVYSDFKYPLIRTFEGLNSLTMTRNTVSYVGDSVPVTLLEDELSLDEWASGKPKITIRDNTINKYVVPLKAIHYRKSRYDAVIVTSPNLIQQPVELTPKNIHQNRPIPQTYIGKIGL